MKPAENAAQKGQIVRLRDESKQFARDNLAELSSELVEWQDTGYLRGAKLHELAELCGRWCGTPDDKLKIAESFVNRAAIEQARLPERIEGRPQAPGMNPPYDPGSVRESFVQQRQEPVEFLADGTRFKMSFFKDGGVRCFSGFEEELDGRWVALVGAENDCHMRYTTPQPTPAQEPVAKPAGGWKNATSPHNFGKPMGYAVVTNSDSAVPFMLSGGAHTFGDEAEAVCRLPEYAGTHHVVELVAKPTYTHPTTTPALLEKAASMLDGYAVQFTNPAPFQGSYEGFLRIRAVAAELREALAKMQARQEAEIAAKTAHAEYQRKQLADWVQELQARVEQLEQALQIAMKYAQPVINSEKKSPSNAQWMVEKTMQEETFINAALKGQQ